MIDYLLLLHRTDWEGGHDVGKESVRAGNWELANRNPVSAGKRVKGLMCDSNKLRKIGSDFSFVMRR